MFLLQRAQLVQSTRGVQGGYLLAKAPEDLSLAEVFQALEPSDLEEVCEKFTGTESECVHSGACAIKAVWKGLNGHITGYLSKVTLRDLAGSTAKTAA